jgi:zinc protease
MTIGSHEDLSAATLEDVRDFFRRYYGPNGASLAIAGDIDAKRARALVERWFADVPPGPPRERRRPEPRPLAAEKRVTLEDDVQLPRLYVAWPSPKEFAPDDARLEIAGEVLGSGKSARLVKRLVMDERIAQSVMAGQQGQALAGMFVVVATPKPGQTLERLGQEIDEEIARLAREAPSPEEVERARNKVESAMVFGLEPVGGFGGRAATLNAYYWETGDPGFFPKDLARYLAVGPEDVRAAAARWLAGKPRVVLSVVPRRKNGAPEPSAAAGAGGRGSHP